MIDVPHMRTIVSVNWYYRGKANAYLLALKNTMCNAIRNSTTEYFHLKVFASLKHSLIYWRSERRLMSRKFRLSGGLA